MIKHFLVTIFIIINIDFNVLSLSLSLFLGVFIIILRHMNIESITKIARLHIWIKLLVYAIWLYIRRQIYRKRYISLDLLEHERHSWIFIIIFIKLYYHFMNTNPYTKKKFGWIPTNCPFHLQQWSTFNRNRIEFSGTKLAKKQPFKDILSLFLISKILFSFYHFQSSGNRVGRAQHNATDPFYSSLPTNENCWLLVFEPYTPLKSPTQHHHINNHFIILISHLRNFVFVFFSFHWPK